MLVIITIQQKKLKIKLHFDYKSCILDYNVTSRVATFVIHVKIQVYNINICVLKDCL